MNSTFHSKLKLMQTELFVIVKYVLKFKEYLLELFKDA